MERKESEDLSTIIKSTGIIGLGQFFNIILRYFYTTISTRLLGATIYGTFILGRSIIKITSIICEFGMGLAVQRQIAFYSGRRDERKIIQSIRLSLIIPLINGIFLLILFYLLRDFIALRIFKNNELHLALKILYVSIPLITLLNIFYNIFQGLEKIKYRIYLEYIIFHLSNILFLVILVYFGLKIKGIVVAFILANLIGLICAIIFFTKIKIPKKKIKIEKNTQKELFGYAIPLVFSSSLDFLQRWGDIIILGILSTSFAVGIYNVTLRLGAFVALPLVAINLVFSPMIANIYAQNDIKRLEFNYKIITKLIYTFSLFIFSFIFLFPQELLSIFGNEFKGASTALIVICFGQLINSSVGSSGRMLVMTGHPVTNLINSIAFIVCSISLNLLLIPKYGVLGAAIANFITLGLLNFVRVIQIYKYIHIQPFRWDYLKPLISILFSITIIFYLKKIILINLFTFTLLVFGLSLMYFLFIFLLGITDEEKFILLQIKENLISTFK